ncbi:intersectin-1-like [Macrobrachium nipponense]|uniref:intersectin-1-like n=1 Tax=Macrobrachium nipponense TaxID=159736 RepID=UPI0030C81E3B
MPSRQKEQERVFGDSWGFRETRYWAFPECLQASMSVCLSEAWHRRQTKVRESCPQNPETPAPEPRNLVFRIREFRLQNPRSSEAETESKDRDLLPGHPHRPSSPVAALRWILAFFPRLGSFLKSRQDLQRCEIVARHLEKELEKVHSNLGFFQCLKTLMTEKVGHICLFSAVCLTLGAISLLKRFVCSKKQETELEEDDLELDWSSLESEEIEELQLMEENALLKRQKEELEAENGRLCRKIDVLQKKREIQLPTREEAVVEGQPKPSEPAQSNKELEAEYDPLVFSDYEALQSQRAQENERAKKTIDDLQESNDQLLMEIADKDALAQQHLKKAEDLQESVSLLKEELERTKEQNRANIEIQSRLLKENEELKNSIEEAHKAKEECLNTLKAKKGQRKLITFDLPPDQPQMKSIFSGLASPKESPKSHQATSGQKEEEKIVVTVKKRVKDGKRDVSFEKKEAHKPEEGCQQPQKERKVERKCIVFDLEPDQPEVIRSISGLSRPLPRHRPPHTTTTRKKTG